MKATGILRWLKPLLRYGLCAAAVYFLVVTVPWHDKVWLNDAQRTEVRLLAQRPHELVVLRDGRQETLPLAQVHRVKIEGREVLDITYGFPSVVRQTDKLWALWSILIFAPVPFLVSWRLIWMLAIQQVPLSFWNAVKFTFAGNFFNFALPGSTGGDVIKAYYITLYTHRKTEAVTTVFLDRAIGLLGLVVVAGLMILFTQDIARFRQLGMTLALICAVLAVGCVIIFSRRVRRTLHLAELLNKLPKADQLRRVGQATLAMRHHKLLVGLSLLNTIALQALCMVSAAVMAWALGMHGSFSYFFIYVAIGFLIAAIPSTPQAVGVMESAYIMFFTQGDHNTASQAVALALAVRLIQLVWSVPGVLVPLLGAHLPPRSELQELEQPAGAADAAPAQPGPAAPQLSTAPAVKPATSGP